MKAVFADLDYSFYKKDIEMLGKRNERILKESILLNKVEKKIVRSLETS